MRVGIDDEVAYLLAVLAEQRIKVPKRLFLDLMEGQLGSMNSAAALGKVTAALFEKLPAERVAFPEVFDVLFQATRDAFEELEAEWRAQWSAEVDQREARQVTPKQLAKLRQAAKSKRGKNKGARGAA